ncbi:hypothetical protein BKA64DRAFT_680546 [Cadophora sp. MPI-SDFR-AT-0126]|nr:hypothetical protein BKA64DRAFT_680546 [Leotiomycetes sp. MPI-SDFR-AT-0126]
MTENQGGSCEPCKRKKCKCDRQLPSCGQCETSKLSCTYGESTKRGIPTGYLGLLEQRLSETEILLYHALSELRALKLQQNTYSSIPGTLDIPDPIPRETNAPKQVRMEEWKEYPLKKEEDIERWRKFIGGETESPMGYGGPTLPEHPAYHDAPNQQYSETDPPPTYPDTDMDFNVAEGLMGLSQRHGQNQPQTQNSINNAEVPPPTQLSAILNPGFPSPPPPFQLAENYPSQPLNYITDTNTSQNLHVHQGMSGANPNQNPNSVLGKPISSSGRGWEASPSAPTTDTIGQNVGTQRTTELVRSQQLSAAFKNIYY